MFFLIRFMCTFAVVTEGDRYFMRSTIRLGKVVKWMLLMAWSKVFLTGMESAMWYHLSRSGLLLAARPLSAAGCCSLGVWLGLLFMLTCHIPDVFDQFPSNNVRTSLTTLRQVAVRLIFIH